METSISIKELSIENFIQFLKESNISKFYFVYDPIKGKVISSHELLNDITDFLNEDRIDFEQHEGLFFQLDSELDVIHSAAIHRTNRGQAAGGVRFWRYDTVIDFVIDGLRLSKGMTHKNALAGLWWGGGKGVIAKSLSIDINDNQARKIIYSNFGKFITSLNGCYVTAEDVGTNVSDMANVFANTRFTTCIPESLGGSGNPSLPTAKGVLTGMEAALMFSGLGSLENKTIAIQGLGNVAIPLIEYLFEKNVKKIIAADIFDDRIKTALSKFKNFPLEAYKINKNDCSILEHECDILSPCATGAILNDKTIPNIKAKIICGAANNQLADPAKHDQLLFNSGILYVPDFLTNRMGIVNCANEQYGYINDDPMITQHFDKSWEGSIYNIAMKVFSESAQLSIPTGKVALDLADKLSKVDHPIFGHRSVEIIKSLVESNWINI